MTHGSELPRATPRRRSPIGRTIVVAFASLLIAGAAANAQARHVVIDTDAGPDDLMAIAFLLGRSDVRIDAITTVTGLSRADVGARNVLRLLHLAGADSVPVYVGSAEHLQPTMPFPPAWVRATEALGAAAAPPPPATRVPESASAVNYMATVLSSGDRRRELLALGPLTNLALAMRRIGRDRVTPVRTVIMGGALDVPGNLVTPESNTDNTRAEWNLFSDPLAAREVLASPLRPELIALDATRHVRIDVCFVRAIARAPSTPLREYVGRIMESAREWIERGDYYAWDPLAAVALADSGAVTLSRVAMTVDTQPPFAGWTHRAPGRARVDVATTADRTRFMKVFDSALGPRGSEPLPPCP